MSEDQTSFTDTTIAAMEAARPRRLLEWAIRSVISATILVWLSSRYPWAKWILYVWMVMAGLGLALILFLPPFMRSRLEKLERTMMGGFDPSVLGDGFGIEDREVTQPVALEIQLEELEAAGIDLAEGKSVRSLEGMFEREVYEDRPYGTLLMALGLNVDGWLSDEVWNFDARCIEGEGSYARIVEQLVRISGAEDRVTGIGDRVDLEAGTAELWYRVDGELKERTATVEGDWADGAVMTEVMGDLVAEGWGFYGVDNGEGSVIVYVETEGAERLTELAPGDVLLIA